MSLFDFELEFVDGEEAEEIDRFAAEMKQREEITIEKRRNRRAEINRETGRKKRKKKQNMQLNLFGE